MDVGDISDDVAIIGENCVVGSCSFLFRARCRISMDVAESDGHSGMGDGEGQYGDGEKSHDRWAGELDTVTLADPHALAGFHCRAFGPQCP